MLRMMSIILLALLIDEERIAITPCCNFLIAVSTQKLNALSHR